MVLALGISLVQAAPQDAQSTAGSTGQYSTSAANTVSAEGGNVTQVNVSSDSSTGKWQGFWGNISGSLQLGDGSATFYDWSSVSFQAVYASPGNSITWGSLTSLSGNLTAKDTDYGFTSSDADSINNTMTGASCNAGTEIASADGVTPYNSSGSAGSWETCIAEDTSDLAGTVFGTNIISAGADAYNGDNVQYQLMVPVNGATQNYYFYLEI